MSNRRRKHRLYIWLTDEEKNIIRERASYFGFTDISAYVRKTAIDVTVLNINTDGLKELAYQVGKIGNNINQISKKYNEKQNLDATDIYMLLQYQKLLIELVNREYDNITTLKNQSKVDD